MSAEGIPDMARLARAIAPEVERAFKIPGVA
jgi:hypothetical protein